MKPALIAASLLTLFLCSEALCSPPCSPPPPLPDNPEEWHFGPYEEARRDLTHKRVEIWLDKADAIAAAGHHAQALARYMAIEDCELDDALHARAFLASARAWCALGICSRAARPALEAIARAPGPPSEEAAFELVLEATHARCHAIVFTESLHGIYKGGFTPRGQARLGWFMGFFYLDYNSPGRALENLETLDLDALDGDDLVSLIRLVPNPQPRPGGPSGLPTRFKGPR